MSYEYTCKDLDGDFLRVVGAMGTKCPEPQVLVQVMQSKECLGARISAANAPGVAIALLKAAGRADLAEMVKQAEAEAKLPGRRDALATELKGHSATYEGSFGTLQRAIDRIIELEDGK